MRCRRAQAHIALLVGDDLEEPTLSRLRDHLDGCPQCRDHAHRMRGVLDVLGARPDETAEGGDSTNDDSLWPRLCGQLPKVARGSLPAADFNGWYPAVAVAAVCFLIVTSAREAPPPNAPQPAGVEASPAWSMTGPMGTGPTGAGVAAEAIARQPGEQQPGGQELSDPAEGRTDQAGPNAPRPHPFEFRQDGTWLDGSQRGPGDPLMNYAGNR